MMDKHMKLYTAQVPGRPAKNKKNKNKNKQKLDHLSRHDPYRYVMRPKVAVVVSN